MIMLKDNHIDYNGSITNAVKMAKTMLRRTKKVKIEVETRNLEEVQEAINAKVDRIMLDNMDVKTMKQAVEMINGSCESEASGGITRDMLKEIASTGVTYISVGALHTRLRISI
jgi:nicotinate-nucleotide pyrophosphorylase (carboxylating)